MNADCYFVLIAGYPRGFREHPSIPHILLFPFLFVVRLQLRITIITNLKYFLLVVGEYGVLVVALVFEVPQLILRLVANSQLRLSSILLLIESYSERALRLMFGADSVKAILERLVRHRNRKLL